jgi:hypothetical protein
LFGQAHSPLVEVAGQVGTPAAPAGGNPQAATADLTVSAPPSSGGGGALDGWDLMLAVGVVLIIRAPARRRLRGDRELPRSRRR